MDKPWVVYLGIGLALISLATPDMIPDSIRFLCFIAGIGLVIAAAFSRFAHGVTEGLRSIVAPWRSAGRVPIRDAIEQIAARLSVNAAPGEEEIIRMGRAEHGLAQLAYEGRVVIRGRTDKGERVGPIPTEFWKDQGFDLITLMHPGAPAVRTESKSWKSTEGRYADMEISRADLRVALREARRNKGFGTG